MIILEKIIEIFCWLCDIKTVEYIENPGSCEYEGYHKETLDFDYQHQIGTNKPMKVYDYTVKKSKDSNAAVMQIVANEGYNAIMEELKADEEIIKNVEKNIEEFEPIIIEEVENDNFKDIIDNPYMKILE